MITIKQITDSINKGFYMKVPERVILSFIKSIGINKKKYFSLKEAETIREAFFSFSRFYETINIKMK